MKNIHIGFYQRVEKTVWRWLYPVFPRLEHFFVRWHRQKRQKYHLGWLAPGKTLQDFERYLHETWGFGNHFVAWEDPDQVLSWRKLVDFEHQYHIRVFSDGEIRGHYEYTPEAKPIRHFAEMGEEEKLAEFKKFLGPFVVKEKYYISLQRDMNTAPESEITVDNTSG